MSEHIACRLTAALPAALCTIGVHGPNAMDLVLSRLERCRLRRNCRGQDSISSSSSPPSSSSSSCSADVSTFRASLPARIHFAHWPLLDGSVKEDVVVCVVGPQTVEVHCHGGVAVSNELLEGLRLAGCQIVGWETWLQKVTRPVRGFLSDVPMAFELWENEPLKQSELPGGLPRGLHGFSVGERRLEASLRLSLEKALLKAVSDKAAGVLLDQYNGALWRSLVKLKRDLESDSLDSARIRIDQLLRWRDLGTHLTVPWQVVLAGPPNVGKSSLINALTGQPQSIVHHQAGTTRDWIEAQTQIDGWPICLTDTAGIRDTREPVEAEGVRRARDRIASADLIVLVIDATIGWTPEHDRIVSYYRERDVLMRKKLLCAWNKSDLVDSKNSVTSMNPVDCFTSTCVRNEQFSTVHCSAHDDISELLLAIVEVLVPAAPSIGEAVPFTVQQVELLQRIAQQLQSGGPNQAIDWFHELTENVPLGTEDGRLMN